MTRGVAAGAALRASALLRGGVSTHRVWSALEAEPHAPAELRVLAELQSGTEPPPATLGQEWRVLLAAWRLAAVSGAPLATVLERLGESLTALDRLAERRSVLLAGPRATIKLVASLPPLALLLGWVLGFDPVAVLLSPVGALLLVFGGGLLALGVWWANRLIDRLAAAEWVAGLECELAWVAISGGGAPALALRRVADSVDAARAEWVRLSSLNRQGSVRGVLASASSLGTSAGAMLLAEGQALRSLALASLEQEAEKLAVRVLVPLGVCVLPSFIVLGVLPVLLSVLGGMSFTGTQ